MRKMIPGVLVLAAAFWMVMQVAMAAALESAKIGDAAPNFTLQDDQGKSVSLADYSGKIVVLEWTNPTCPFVQRHYKEQTFVKLADKYKDKNVVWIAVNSTAKSSNAINHQWAEQNKLAYAILNDSEGKVGRAYGATNTPDMFIIDAKGKLAYMGGIDDDPEGNRGSARVNYVDKALSELTTDAQVSTPQTKPYGCGIRYAH